MKCIFCKNNSTGSKSVEHVIPESLGNKRHVLPVGVVCDKCNQYFSRKVEKPVLESLYFSTLRSEEDILSKKGKPAQVLAVLTPGRECINIAFLPDTDNENSLSIVIPDAVGFEKIQSTLAPKQIEHSSLYIPVCPEEPPKGLLNRFICKVALEALALKLLNKYEVFHNVIYDTQLDLIRNHARRGNEIDDWPYHQRIIYERHKSFVGKDGQKYQMVHEFDFLQTETNELYFVLVIFGVEYATNMAGPCIDGYIEWLRENDNASPLYQE